MSSSLICHPGLLFCDGHLVTSPVKISSLQHCLESKPEGVIGAAIILLSVLLLCCCCFLNQLIREWEVVGFQLNMPHWPLLPERWFKNRQGAREFPRLTFSRGREKLLQCPLAKYTHFSLYGWPWSRVPLFRRKRAWNNHTAEPPEAGGGLLSGSRAQGVPVKLCLPFFIFLKEKAFWGSESPCQKTKVV